MSTVFRSIINGSFKAHSLKYSRCLFQVSQAQIIKYASTATFPHLIECHPELKTHNDLHKFSIEHPESFWDIQAKSMLTWSKMYSSDKIMNCDMKKGEFKWFEDGQLNASVNCVDR